MGQQTKYPVAQIFFLAASVLALSVFLAPLWGNYSLKGVLLLPVAIVFCMAGIAASKMAKEPEETPSRFGVTIVLCFAILIHGFIAFSELRSHRGNVIDVYIFQHDAAAAALEGTNPYTNTIRNIYRTNAGFYAPEVIKNGRVHVGFPYPPLSLLFVIPGYLLHDVRYMHVIAVILSAVFIANLRRNWTGLVLACVLLLNPITFFVEARAWTEPLVLLTLCGTVYAAVKRRWWLPVALGMFFASKQYSVLALPFIPMLFSSWDWKTYRKSLLQGLAVTGVFTLPPALWNPSAFWHDVVWFQIAQPFRPDALSLAVLFPKLLWFVLPAVVLAVIWCLRLGKLNPSIFAASYATTLLVFVCMNKQAFCNYYFLIISVLLLAAAAWSGASTEKPALLERENQADLALEQVG